MSQVTPSSLGGQNAGSLLLPGLRTEFMKGWSNIDLPWKKIATVVDSKLAVENYGWLGQVPQVREFVGERIPKGLSEFTYQIKNKKWETTIRVDADAIEDEQYGQIKTRVQQMPYAVARHQNLLVFSTIEKGDSQTCYDGQFFFDTDHSEGNSGTQSNKGTSALDSSSFGAAKAAMMGFKDDQGQVLGIMPDTLLVPAALEETARLLLNADLVSDGTTTITNVWKNAANLVVSPFLTDANNWYLLDTQDYIKPIIFQNRIPVRFDALEANNSESGFIRDSNLYGVRARYNVGYGDWRTAYGSIVA